MIVDETPLRLVLGPHEPARSADDEQVYVLHDFARLDASEVIKARRTVGSDEQLGRTNGHRHETLWLL